MPQITRQADAERRAAALIERVAPRFGMDDLRWKARTLHFRRGGEKRALDLSAALGALREMDRPDEDDAALELASAAGWPVPPEVLAGMDRVRERLRPRLVTIDALAGPTRAMCRREAFGGLLVGVRIGAAPGAPFVTTRQLDDWGAAFESVVALATENLSRVITRANLHEIDGSPGILCVVHEREPGSSGVFVIDHILPGHPRDPGVVFSLPDEDVMLILPVVEGGGAEGLAAMVELTFRLRHEGAKPLSDQLFWRTGDRVTHLPTTVVEEGRSRRIHLDASGAAEELFRILGAID